MTIAEALASVGVFFASEYAVLALWAIGAGVVLMTIRTGWRVFVTITKESKM